MLVAMYLGIKARKHQAKKPTLTMRLSTLAPKRQHIGPWPYLQRKLDSMPGVLKSPLRLGYLQESRATPLQVDIGLHRNQQGLFRPRLYREGSYALGRTRLESKGR